MFYNQEVFKIAAKIIGHRNGKIPAKKFCHFMPGVIDYLNSTSSTGTITVTYGAVDVMTLVTPPLAERFLSQGQFKIGQITTNELRGWRHEMSAPASLLDGYEVKRGGGYGVGPTMAYAFRPAFFNSMNIDGQSLR
ncbi:MAG: hypothetical protein M3N08_01765 [Pseudomonadota bacterium]|nr:hypothetical protein [Pseudomonadota bacterium]